VVAVELAGRAGADPTRALLLRATILTGLGRPGWADALAAVIEAARAAGDVETELSAANNLVTGHEMHGSPASGRDLAASMAERARSLRVGDALDPQTQIGPAVNAQQLEQNLRYVGIATDEGGKLLTGGDALTLDRRGYYMAPTVIADTQPDQRINCEEVFGPVASTVRVKDYEEALDVANRGEFGLSAGIVTNSLKHARHFRRNIRAGMVMVNLPTAGVDYHVPFGGTRKSSYGAREQGFAAVEFYTQTKTVYIGG